MYSYVENIIFTCHATLQVKLKKELKNPVDLEFNSRMKRVFGRWKFSNNTKRHTLQFNSNAFKEESRVFRETIIHEFCHAAAYELYNDAGHGQYWKYLMTVMGISPDRCISQEKCQEIGYTPKRNIVRRYTYKCNCMEHNNITLGIHKKIQSGATYKCKHCRSAIRLA